jgi:protein-disulfide isomerase
MEPYTQQKTNHGLIIAIVFAALAISGSIVFFALQSSPTQGTASILDSEVLDRLEKLEALDDLIAQLENKPSGGKAQEENRPTVRKNFPHIDKENDHIRGNPDAQITIIEYSDFECPFCGRFHPTAKELVVNYNEDVNWVYRHFPLSFHDPNATTQAMATECVADIAGNEAFWKMTDSIYENTNGNKSGPMGSELVDLAVDAGADRDQFQECLDTEKFKNAIQSDLTQGSKAGVNGTPGNFIINNKTQEVLAIPGAQPYQALQAVIDEML